MTRKDFEREFTEVIESSYRRQNRMNWHTYVENNMWRLSDDSLRFIIENAGNPFGTWIVDRAVYLTAFEDVVLLGEEDEHK